MRSFSVVLVLAALVTAAACGGDDECAPKLEGAFVMQLKLTGGESTCPAGRPIVVDDDGSMELEPGCAPVEVERASCIAQTAQRCVREGCTVDYSMWLDGKSGTWRGEYTAEASCFPGDHASCVYDVEVEDR